MSRCVHVSGMVLISLDYGGGRTLGDVRAFVDEATRHGVPDSVVMDEAYLSLCFASDRVEPCVDGDTGGTSVLLEMGR